MASKQMKIGILFGILLIVSIVGVFVYINKTAVDTRELQFKMFIEDRHTCNHKYHFILLLKTNKNKNKNKNKIKSKIKKT